MRTLKPEQLVDPVIRGCISIDEVTVRPDDSFRLVSLNGLLRAAGIEVDETVDVWAEIENRGNEATMSIRVEKLER